MQPRLLYLLVHQSLCNATFGSGKKVVLSKLSSKYFAERGFLHLTSTCKAKTVLKPRFNEIGVKQEVGIWHWKQPFPIDFVIRCPDIK
jgi:hypothetical protein